MFIGGLNGTGYSEDTFPRGEGAPVRTLGRMRNGDAVGCGMHPKKWIKRSVSTIFSKCKSVFHISPFLISHPNRFRSADLGDSFPPGEAMGAAAPVREITIYRITH